jgi:hypothetical protein
MGRPKAIKPSAALTQPKGYRAKRDENQSEFWMRFGVTQSGGSRYENERTIPDPVALLLVLFDQGKISHEDLLAAGLVVDASRRV